MVHWAIRNMNVVIIDHILEQAGRHHGQSEEDFLNCKGTAIRALID